MIIRKATKKDEKSCIALINLAMDGITKRLGLNKNILSKLYLENKQNSRLSYEHIHVVEVNEKIVAAMGCYDGGTQESMDVASGIKFEKECFSKELYIDFIATFKPHRKNGYATALLKSTNEIARNNNLSKIALIAKKDKIKNINFYESLGFKKDDKIIAYDFEFIHMSKEIK